MHELERTESAPKCPKVFLNFLNVIITINIKHPSRAKKLDTQGDFFSGGSDGKPQDVISEQFVSCFGVSFQKFERNRTFRLLAANDVNTSNCERIKIRQLTTGPWPAMMRRPSNP